MSDSQAPHTCGVSPDYHVPGRLSIANLRRIKIHWIHEHVRRLRLRDDDRPDDDADDEHHRAKSKASASLVVVVISVGVTLDAWAADLRAHPGFSAVARVVTVPWRPSKRAPPPRPYVPRAALRATYADQSRSLDETPDDDDGDAGGLPLPDTTRRVLRLWAYGDARVRRRIKPHVDDWCDDGWDFFVA
mmetsp:Transcript_20268/g.80964  ORF Transcript_20268/g.80964 Transcript_20268/m.80964 type:complete len:189 (-) Transcript_20268:75-641(-)